MRKVLIDNQLPAALARWCRDKGCEAEHVLALQMGQAVDAVIWERAARDGAVIISKDGDFAQMTLVRPEPVAVIWLRVGNCRTEQMLEVMERAWPQIEQQLAAGARLIEIY